MAEVIWAEPALNDLDAIADYIALDNPEAARRLVQRVFQHVDHLENHPQMGSKPQELKGWRYRQIVETPAVSSIVRKPVRSSSFTSCARSGSFGLSYSPIEMKRPAASETKPGIGSS